MSPEFAVRRPGPVCGRKAEEGKEVDNESSIWNCLAEKVMNCPVWIGVMGLVGLVGLVGVLEPYKLSFECRITGTGGRLDDGGLLNARWETMDRGLGPGDCVDGRGGGRNEPDDRPRLEILSFEILRGGVRVVGEEGRGGVGTEGDGGSLGIGRGEVGAPDKVSKSMMGIGRERISELCCLNPALGEGALTFGGAEEGGSTIAVTIVVLCDLWMQERDNKNRNKWKTKKRS